MIRRQIALLILLACVAMPASACAEAARQRHLVWHDEFSGSAGALPDSRRWSFMTGGNGWGNQELQCYTDAPGNVATDGDGHLVISAIRQPGHVCSDGRTNDYTSARISTQHHASVRYGWLEVRAKLPAGVGTWPAFWALGHDHDVVGWPASGEIDVMEAVGRKPRDVLGTVHGPRRDGSHWLLPHHHRVAGSLSSRFHTFGVHWTRNRITWFVDHREYAHVTRAEVKKQGRWVFDKRFYLLLNLAIGGNLGGAVDPTVSWPQQYVIDWVRVYR